MFQITPDQAVLIPDQSIDVIITSYSEMLVRADSYVLYMCI